jgi:hypothetical protein
MTANITSRFVAAAAVTILCMASGLLAARVAQTGFARQRGAIHPEVRPRGRFFRSWRHPVNRPAGLERRAI